MILMGVLNGQESLYLEKNDAVSFFKKLPNDCIDLIIGSPPYPEKGERYLPDGPDRVIPKWDTDSWIKWMLEVTDQAVRVCRGDVFWVVNGCIRKHRYFPACEGLIYKWYEKGGYNDRPLIWRKNSPSNRNGYYFRNDWEFVLNFRKAGARKYWDFESIGTPPKYKTGGKFRQRNSKGERVEGSDYPQNEITQPSDVIYATVGGGHMGGAEAHDSEAPYPEKLIQPIILALSPPGSIVCDPFVGSGTTAAVALAQNRRFVGCDIRDNQIRLTQRRLERMNVLA